MRKESKMIARLFFFLMLFLCLFLLKKLKKEDEGEAGFILEVDSKHLI